MLKKLLGFFAPKPTKIIVSTKAIEKHIKAFQKSIPERIETAKIRLGDKYLLSSSNQVKRLSKRMRKKMNLV